MGLGERGDRFRALHRTLLGRLRSSRRGFILCSFTNSCRLPSALKLQLGKIRKRCVVLRYGERKCTVSAKDTYDANVGAISGAVVTLKIARGGKGRFFQVSFK